MRVASKKRTRKFGELPTGAQRYIRDHPTKKASSTAATRKRSRSHDKSTSGSATYRAKRPSSTPAVRPRDAGVHPRDARIYRDDRHHKYYVDGEPVEGSVTTFIQAFFPGFNPYTASQRMLARKDFPNRATDATYRAMDIYDADGKPRPDAQKIIMKKWQTDGMQAANAGTRMHKLIEERCQTPNPCAPMLHTAELRAAEQEFVIEMAQFESYFRERTHQGWVPYRNEQMVYDEQHQMCGAIDMQWRRSENGGLDRYGRMHIMITDFKRTDALRKDAYGGEVGYGPMEAYPANKATLYELQDGLYRWIMERNYNVVVDCMEVVAFHPDILCGHYECIQSELPRETVNAVMAERLQMLRRGETIKDLSKRLREQRLGG